MAKRLYVGNMPYSFSEQDLKDLFKNYPSATKFNLIIDHATGKPKGFAFVDFGSDDEAQMAIKELDKKVVNGKPLTVNEARPQVKREGGGGGRNFSNSGGGRKRF